MSTKRRPTHDRTTRRAAGMTLRFEQLEDRTTPTLPTVTTVVATPASLEIGGTLSVTVTVSEPYPGLFSYQPYGDVRFLIDATELGSVSLDPAADSDYASVASMTIATSTFAAGDHTIRVVYPGEDGYELDGHDPSEGTAAVVLTSPPVIPPPPPAVPPLTPPPQPIPPPVAPLPLPAPPVNRPRLFATGTDAGVAGIARLHNPDGSVRLLLQPYGGEFNGGIRTAVGDVDGDGTGDLITAPGPGGGPVVRVFSGADGVELGSFLAFEGTFLGGVYVTAADLDWDGKSEVIVSPDESGGPRVRVLRGADGTGVVADFFGIEDPNFRGGVRVAAGDANGDLVPDLIVAAGYGGGPRIAVFNGASAITSPGAPGRLVGDFFAFEPSLRNGAYVAAGDLSGDGRADLVFGGGPGGGPRVLALDGLRLVRSGGSERAELVNTFAFDPDDRGGVRVTTGDVDGDGWGDLIVAPGLGGGGSAVAVFGPHFGDPVGIGAGFDGVDGLFVGAESLPPGALQQYGEPPGTLTRMVLEAARDTLLSSIYDLEYLAQYQGEGFEDEAYLEDVYRQLEEIEEEIRRLEEAPVDETGDVPLEGGDFGPGGVPLWPDYSLPDRAISDGILIDVADGAANLEAAMAQVLDVYNRAGADAFEWAGETVSAISGRPEPAEFGLEVAEKIRDGTTDILRDNLPPEQVQRIWPQGAPQGVQPNANASRSATTPLFRTWRGSKPSGHEYTLTVGPSGIHLSVAGRLDQLVDTGSGSSYQFELGADGRSFSARIRGFKTSEVGGGTKVADVTVTGILSADGRTLDLGVNYLPVTMR